MATATARPTGLPDDLVPAIQASIRSSFRLSNLAIGRVQTASLTLGEPGDFQVKPDEIEPRIVLKKSAKAFPQPDRSRKGDPVVGLRPTFDAKLRAKGGLAAWRAGELMLSSDDYLAFDGLAPPVTAQALIHDETFEPWPDADPETTQPSAGDAAPGYVGSALTLRSGGPLHLADVPSRGATLRVLVKWKGRSYLHATWQTPESLTAFKGACVYQLFGGDHQRVIMICCMKLAGIWRPVWGGSEARLNASWVVHSAIYGER